MHLTKSLTMLFVYLVLCSWQSAFALAIQPPENADRPTQRWLPLPQGDGIDLSEQAQLLKQLRDLISSESGSGAGDSPLPKLSEQQLREMEKAVEDLREQIGEDKLPKLENIPKEWIDQALSDPVARRQAQQLLEQYSRDRKLPPLDRTPVDSEGAPFPRRQPSDNQPSDKTPNQNPKSNPNPNPYPKSNSASDSTSKSKSPNTLPDKASNGPASNGTASNGTASNDVTRSGEARNALPANVPASNVPDQPGRTPRQKPSGQSPSDELEQPPIAPREPRDRNSSGEELGQSPKRPLPTRPDAERVEALQELFKKLKTIEEKRQPATNTPKNSSNNADTRKSNQGNSNSGSTNQTMRPNVPGGQPNPAAPRSSRINNSKPTTPLPERTPSGALPSQPAAELPNRDPGNDPIFDPPPFTPKSESSNPARTGVDRTSQTRPNLPDPKNKMSGSGTTRPGGNGLNSADRTQKPWPGSPTEGNQPTSDSKSALTPEVDIKTQLERHGLGRALQSIVEKTLKEQGESTSAKEHAATKNSNTQSKSKGVKTTNKASTPATPAVPPANKLTSNNPTSNNPTPQNPNGIATSNGGGATPPPSGNQNPNTSSTISGLRDMAAQFWGAVRSTPAETSGGSSTGAQNVTGSSFGEFGFDWSGRVWLLLALGLVGIAMLFLFARKRIELAIAARDAEAELAKEILTEGIRTRADVVRAFHRFVLRRAQPVATWWNHRYVASRLTEASPQLRSVITDLASVYEHARYLPPEVALSSDEIDRVQTALKQCAACSV